jgi:hypothetical protein
MKVSAAEATDAWAAHNEHRTKEPILEAGFAQ